MTIHFGYVKAKVIQALRYHFISRREIMIMIILVNVFAISSVVLYFMHKVTPVAFMMGTFLWLALMASFWFILPLTVYRRAVTFKHEFSMDFDEEGFTLRHEKGSKRWPWTALAHYVESPHFFHFYFDNRSFILVPKDGCTNDDELFALRKLIKENVKKG